MYVFMQGLKCSNNRSSGQDCTVLRNATTHTVKRESFVGENFRKLPKVGFLRLKLSRIVRNDNDTLIDNNATVLNENFRS